MNKLKVVHFDDSGRARIYINPDLDALSKSGHVLVNPDLSKVAGVPPENWILKDGEIIARTADVFSFEEYKLDIKRRERRKIALKAAAIAGLALISACVGAIIHACI